MLVYVAVIVNGRLDVNVVLNRTAYQSSTYGDSIRLYGPELANDGNRNTDFTQESCMATWAGQNPWYAVDFGVKLYVSGIKFTSRDLPCCRMYNMFSLMPSFAYTL